jgi:hypothetical protein
MSLKLAADELKSYGRNGDTQLIHMTPGEIKGLQQLAEAHGGSLTTNPDTGLPEANFLKKLLPTIIGAGVGIATGNPYLGAAIAGIGGVAQTGSLMGGISAGLGAYSGANLFGGLGAAGAKAATTAGSGLSTTTSGVLSSPGASILNPQSGLSMLNPTSVGVAGSLGNTAGATLLNPATAVGGLGTGGNMVANVADDVFANTALSQTANIPGYVGSATSPADYFAYQKSLGMSPMGNLSNTFSNAGKGFSNLVSDPSKGLAFIKDNPGTVFGTGMTILGAMPPPKVPGLKEPELDEYDKRLARYKLSPDFEGTFPTPPSPAYQSQYANYARNPYNPYAAEGGVMRSYAQGGIASLAQGGMGGNQGYPQGRLDTTQYATPSQMPTSAQVVNADYEVPIDPYMGSPLKMAEGGVPRYFFGGNTKSNSDSQVYYDADRGEYYTQASRPGFGGMVGSMMGGIFNAIPGMNDKLPSGALSDPNSPFFNGRTYLGSSLGGKDTSFQAPQITPDIYQPGYSAPEMSMPAQNAMPMPTATPDYSLADSLPLLQASDSNIAAQFMPRGEKKAKGGIASYSGKRGSKVEELSPEQVKAMAGLNLDSDPNTRDLDALSAAKYRNTKLKKRFGMSAVPDQRLNIRGLGDVAPTELAAGGSARYNLGSYAAGGNPRLLKGPGDGMSDNIPAVIGDKQPARLADGEFVVPADVVSHLGNGSTDAGAKHLYTMMDRIRKARTGNKKQGKQINPTKFLPR